MLKKKIKNKCELNEHDPDLNCPILTYRKCFAMKTHAENSTPTIDHQSLASAGAGHGIS